MGNMDTQGTTEQYIKPISRRAATIANLVFQYISISLAIINGFVLVPLYLRYIDYKLYGAWLATGSIVSWLGLVDAGMSDIVRQRTAQVYGARDLEQAGKYIGTSLICISAVGMMPMLISFGVAPFLPVLFGLESRLADSLVTSFILAGVSCSLAVIASSAYSVQQGLQRHLSVCVIHTTGSIIGLIATVWMLVSGYGLISIPLGLVFRGIMWVCIFWPHTLYFCLRTLHMRLQFSRRHFYKIATLTGWSFLSRISYQFFNQCDALIVGLFMGVEVVPVFVLTKRAWDILAMLLERISVAFMPGLAHLHGEEDEDKFTWVSRRLLRIVMYASLAGAGVCLAFNKTFVNLWLGPKLYAGQVFNVLIGLGILTRVFVFTINRVLFAAGIIKGPSIAMVIQNSARAALLIPLIWILGLPGAALSLVVTFVTAGAFYFGKEWVKLLRLRGYDFCVDLLGFAKIGAVILILSYIFAEFVTRDSWLWFINFSLCLVLIEGVVFYIFDKYFRAEVRGVLLKIGSRIKRMK
jgi:O-antigen/teichoic acid export membrane protein